MATTTSGPRGDIGQLTGLRFVAALWVLLHHASFLPLDAYERWLAPIRPVLAAGPLGVDLFFALSGMVLARSYLERWQGSPDLVAVGRYVWARIARVWPLYAVVVVGFGLWCAARARWGPDGVIVWQSVQPGLGPSSWLDQLTMTQLWTSPRIDGISFVLPTWSVSAEFAAYLVFPAIAVVAWRIRHRSVAALALGAVTCSAAALVVRLAGLDDWLWAVRLTGSFVAGVLVWLVVARVRVTPLVARRANAVALLALAEILLVVYWAAAAPETATVPAATRLAVAVPLFPVLLGALALGDPARGLAGLLARPAVQRGGRRSYALYLVHFPVMEVALAAMTWFPAIGAHTAGAALLVPNLLPVALVLAALAHRYVEEPARVWMLQRTGRPTPALDRQPAEDRARDVTQDGEQHPQWGGRPDQLAPSGNGVDGDLGHLLGRRGEWGGAHALGHLRVHEAGPDDRHADAVGPQGLGEPGVEGVHARLGGAVDEVGAPRALAGDRGERDDPAVALTAELVGERDPHRHGGHVVDLGKRDGGVVVLPGLLLVTEEAEGDHGHVDVTAGEGLAHRGGVALTLEGVELDGLDGRTRPLEARACLGEAFGLAPGEDHVQRSVGEVALGDCQRDL